MKTATATFEAGLRGEAVIDVVRSAGRCPLPIPAWSAGLDAADRWLIGGCAAPTLDVGCGPGRFAGALVRRGVPALGIDISGVAVAMTRRRGAPAIVRDVFGPVPGAGRWHHILLADGNLGIGGDPGRLLRRCAELLASQGTVLVDLEPPGTGVVVEEIRLAAGERISLPFAWSWVGTDAVQRVAAPAGLAAQQVWRVGDRWQARLVRSR